MSIKLSFISPDQFHYTLGVVEKVESKPGDRFYYGENWKDGHFVRVEWKNQIRDFICRTNYWKQQDYEEDWQQEFDSLANENQPAVMIVNFSDSEDETAAELCRWYYLYKNKDQFSLYYGEGWAAGWEDKFNEKVTPEKIKQRCKEDFSSFKEWMQFEADLKSL